MSNLVQGWAWQQKVKGTDKLVLVALADRADDDGICWPGLKGIAEKCGITRRTVSTAVQRLQEAGLLTVEERQRPDGSRTSNRYLLAMAPMEVSSISLEDNRSTPSNSRGDAMNETVVPLEHEGGTGYPIDPSSNPNGIQTELTEENQVKEKLPDYMIDLAACPADAKYPFVQTHEKMTSWLSGKKITASKADETAAYIKGNWPGPRKSWKDPFAVFRTLVVKVWADNNTRGAQRQPVRTGAKFKGYGEQ